MNTNKKALWLKENKKKTEGTEIQKYMSDEHLYVQKIKNCAGKCLASGNIFVISTKSFMTSSTTSNILICFT